VFKRKRYRIAEGEMVIDMTPEAAEYYPEVESESKVEDKEPFSGEEMSLSMGPQHPSTHGVLRLELVLDGEVVKKVTPHLGYMHRCFEKHAENVPYNEVIPYTDRLDYIAAMNQNMAYVLAVEKLMGDLKIPEPVEYIRVLCCELNRIASHLVALGTYGLDVGAFTPFLWCFRDREKILDLLERISGARMLYNYIWIGGVARPLPDGWTDEVARFCDYFEPKIDELDRLLTYNWIFIERTATAGVLPPEVAVSYGATGPVLRGCGIPWDLRKNEPYSIYDRFEFDIPTGLGRYGPLGSAWDRYWVRVQEMRQSLRIIRQALRQMPKTGNVHEAIPRKIRPPVGEAYARSETPRGELGFYLVSDGSEKPYRVKARSPCFCNISVIDEISRGAMVADLVAIIGSIDIVLCEIDR